MEEKFQVYRAQSEPIQVGGSKPWFSSRIAALNARKGFVGALDKILGSTRPPSNQQQLDESSLSTVVVGPVIGKVTHNSARVLIEINGNALVTAVLEAQKQEPESPQTRKAKSQSLQQSLQSWSWRSFQFKRGQSTATTTTAITRDEEEQPQVFSVEKELKAGRPGVFHFSNLKPRTRYKVHFRGCHCSISGSFRTLDVSSTTQRLSFGVISCNNVYITQKAIPIHSDLWEQLSRHISAGKVDYLLHLGDQIYADVDPEVGGPHLNRFESAKSILRGLTPEEREEQWEKICELFRQVYRDTWQHPPTAKCLANCPSLMILDDHEIRDNWGDIPQDWERESVEFFIARCGWLVYLEYQRQLHEDVDFSSLESIQKEYHFHVLGGVGLMFVDIRGSRTFHRVEGDESVYLGTEQWKDISDSLSSPGGIFNGVSVLFLCATAPLVFLEPVITNVAAQSVNRLEDFKGHWSANRHTKEQIRMIDSLITWKSAQPGREVLALGGDVHCGGHSCVFKDNELVFHQLTSSAIANTSLPKSAYYIMRFAGRLGVTLRSGYTFKHYHWTRSRNYGLVRVKIQRLEIQNDKPASPQVTTQLVKGKFMRGILFGSKVTSKSKRKKKCIIRCCS